MDKIATTVFLAALGIVMIAVFLGVALTLIQGIVDIWWGER